MKTWTNEQINQSEDEWVLNRLILNNPEEFLAKKENLKFQIKHMPPKFKKSLKYEISLAEKLSINVDLLTRSILAKKYEDKTRRHKTINKKSDMAKENRTNIHTDIYSFEESRT